MPQKNASNPPTPSADLGELEIPQPQPADKLHGRALVTTVQLPSLGVPYGGKLGDGKVRISAITVQEQKIFAAAATDPNDKLDILFNRTCDLRGLMPGSLVLGDRFFLFLQLRALSLGNTYGFQFKCGECGTQFRHQLNIIKDLALATIGKGFKEPWELFLPIANRTVALRLLRGDDEKNIASMVAQQEQKGLGAGGDISYPLTLAYHIVTIDGEEVNEFQAVKFVEGLVASDVNSLRQSIEDTMPGYDPNIIVACIKCGFRHEAALELGTEFFRPRVSN